MYELMYSEQQICDMECISNENVSILCGQMFHFLHNTNNFIHYKNRIDNCCFF